jgi:hypothetical protein
MLVLRRKEREWTTVVHSASGDVMRIFTANIRPGGGGLPPVVDLAFEDDARNFTMHRPERGTPFEPGPI